MKKQIITIAGLPGSGKSSTAKGVAAALGYEHFSSGDLFRKIGAEMGFSIEETNFAAETQKEIDHQVDETLVKIGKEKENIVIDSRMAFHWIPDSFKVFLNLDLRVAAERIFAHIQKGGRVSQAGSSVEEVYQNTVKRLESEQKRYANLYQIDVTDESHYDLLIDTGAHDLNAVIAMVLEKYKEWLGSQQSQ